MVAATNSPTGNLRISEERNIKKGTTVKEFAYMIHTELGEKFICAIDAKRKMKIPEDYKIKNGDVIKIVSAA